MAKVTFTDKNATDLFAESGIAVGTKVEIVALTSGNTIQIFNTELTPNVSSDDFLPLVYGTQKVLGEVTDLGLWVYSTQPGAVDIREVT